MFLFAPVDSRHWRQYELYDGTYTFGDLMDYHEMIMVSKENQRRAEDAAERQRQGG